MNYAKFLDDEDINKILGENIGIPLKIENNKYLSINDKPIGYLPNNLIIGSKGSNVINNTILPLVDNIINFKENIIIRDNYNIYEKFKDKLKDYNIIILDYENLDQSMKYNIFDLIENIYKESDYKAINMLNEILMYLFHDEGSNDPFWINSARNLFSGIALFKLENKEHIDLLSIYKLVQDFNDENKSIEFINSLDKDSIIYINLSPILYAPTETRKSIISVFNQVINCYLTSNKLIDILTNSDFNLTSISDPYIIFIKGDNYISRIITNILISQINNTNMKCNIILPDFDNMNLIYDLPKIINNKNINYTITISSYTNLKNKYGLEKTEILKMCFENTIYLLSHDNETLEEICYMCGNKELNTPLITPFDLLHLNKDEAIILMSRVYPIKIKLGGMKNE